MSAFIFQALFSSILSNDKEQIEPSKFDNLVIQLMVEQAELTTTGETSSRIQRQANKRGEILTAIQLLENRKRSEQDLGLLKEITDGLSAYDIAYPKDPIKYLLRGIFHQKLQENEQANQEYEKGLKMDPAHKDLNAFIKTVLIEVKESAPEEKKAESIPAKPETKNQKKKRERRAAKIADNTAEVQATQTTSTTTRISRPDSPRPPIREINPGQASVLGAFGQRNRPINIGTSQQILNKNELFYRLGKK